jgi:PTS system galactitol-specific IIC component
MESLKHFLSAFFGFKAYVMLPIIIFMIALAVRVPLKRALLSTVSLAAGFAGVFIAFNFFVTNISPAVQQLSQVRGLNFPVLDVGWPPLAAITWASPLAAISIPMVLIANLLMLATGLTRTIYIDIWNYWHFAMIGALVLALSGSMWLGLSATLLIAIYCFKLTEWTAPDVEREMGLKGISASPVSVNGIVPYSACVDWLIDRIPVLNKINYNPEASHQIDVNSEGDTESNSLVDLLREPMVIGLLMGLALALAADYDVRATLEMAVHIAAVMFLLPKSAGLIGEAMIPITNALRSQVERVFPQRKNLIVALDTGFLMGHKSVIMTGLILMGLAIGIALVLPGNRVLPLGDLPNLISVMSISVLMFRGNVFRAVLAGIPVIITFLLISSSMAPLFTDLARKTPSFNMDGLGLITAFTDGGHQVRFLIFHLYQGELWAFAVLAVLLAAMVFTKKRFEVNAAALDRKLNA